jgi:hypothetical protein
MTLGLKNKTAYLPKVKSAYGKFIFLSQPKHKAMTLGLENDHVLGHILKTTIDKQSFL